MQKVVYTLRRAEFCDIPFLLQLRMKTMHSQLVRSGVHLGESEHMARVMHRFDSAQIICVDGADAGVLKVIVGGGVRELLQIQIDPRYQGCGIGRSVLRDAIDDARRCDQSIFLNVLKENPARYFYMDLGFHVVAEEENEFRMLLSPEKFIVRASGGDGLNAKE